MMMIRVDERMLRMVLDHHPIMASELAIPIMAQRPWEPPHVTEQRIMWNATEREPYWPDPALIELRFTRGALEMIADDCH